MTIARREFVTGMTDAGAAGLPELRPESTAAHPHGKRRQRRLSVYHGGRGLGDAFQPPRLNPHARRRTGDDIRDEAGDRIDALMVDLSGDQLDGFGGCLGRPGRSVRDSAFVARRDPRHA